MYKSWNDYMDHVNSPEHYEEKRQAEWDAGAKQVALNPHQFGEQGTLFDAPLGQPDAGTFTGNPHARMYRAVGLHEGALGIHRYEGGFGYEHPPAEEFHQSILDNANRPRKDAGHDTNMGIHWQHDLMYAHDYANSLKDSGIHGEKSFPVIIEADHPGTDHVIDRTPMPGGGPPDELHGLDPDSTRVPRNKLTGYAKDWSLVNDTVGPHNLDSMMVPEVPVRPGAPLRVHAVHTPDPESPGNYIRNPVQFRGLA